MMSTSVLSSLAQNDRKIRLLESHNLSSQKIIEGVTGDNGQHFHGTWLSGLTQTTYLGLSDTELISPLKRASLLDEPSSNAQQVGCRSIYAAYDADSGGPVSEIPELVNTLAQKGASMIIIEDKSTSKPGAKVNSLGETSVSQDQANPDAFADTIRAFKSAYMYDEMMITARIESFTTRTMENDASEEQASIQKALRDALHRARVYRDAGADAIMIHSKAKAPDEVLAFLSEYRATDRATPLVVVPTTYYSTTEDTLYQAGANVIIYANHLMRAKIHAVGLFSDRFLTQRPQLFRGNAELRACLEARNFGCLLRKLVARKNSTQDLYEEGSRYRAIAERFASDNMRAVAKRLLEGGTAGAADPLMISVKELLQVNAQQVSDIESLMREGVQRWKIEQSSAKGNTLALRRSML